MKRDLHQVSELAAANPSGEGPGSRELFVQLTPTRDHLRQLFIARNVVLLAALGAITVATAEAGSALRFPWVEGVLGVLGLAALLNLFTRFRLRQSTPVSHLEFSMQIVADVLLLTAALYHSGGEASPFNDLYFVPLVIAAATLPLTHTLVVALIIVGCHWLACAFDPLSGLPKPDNDMVELLTGGLIAYFVFNMARASRRHEHLLSRTRESYLKQEHSRELGTLAAITADQMSSPLATMAVVVGELRAGLFRSSGGRQALDVVANGIQSCKQTLSRLLEQAGYSRTEGGTKVAADKFLATIVDKCQLMQPGMAVRCSYDGATPAPEICADTSLEQAILALLNGSPAATSRQVVISGRQDETRLQIEICARERADANAYSDTPGRSAPAPEDRTLLMAKTAISRFGGTVEDLTRRDGRVRVRVSLPLLASLPEGPTDVGLTSQSSTGRLKAKRSPVALIQGKPMDKTNGKNDPPSLLLTDDDRTLCSVLACALEKRGFRVSVAHDYQSALALAAADPPDFAVVDLKMPGTSGLCLTRKLTELDANTRILVLTGYGSIATAIEAVKLGAHHYLTKPADADDIVAVLRCESETSSAPICERPLSVNRLEWEHINRVLTGNNGNISATARVLGMHRRTLQRKLSKHPVRA